jgi:hypothetical protein
MRNILIILFLTVFWSCTSCNGNNSGNDSDSLPDSNDSESLVDLDSTQDSDLNIDTDSEVDEEADDVEFADVDYQGAEDCPALKAAKFPYYNDDLSIHFCRKCDKPTVDDPQCVKNLWSEANKKYFEKFPERDCLGYPCVIKGLRATVKSDDVGYGYFTDCDRDIPPSHDLNNMWSAGRSDWRHHFFDKGKVIFDMYSSISSTPEGYVYPTDGRVFSYNLEKDKYTVIMPNNGVSTLAYHNGKSLSQTMNYNKVSDKDSFSTAFKTQFLVMYEEGKGYRVIYPGTVRFIPYSSITISDKWVFMVFQEEDGKQYQMKYAKVGEWNKWYEMERETVNVPNLSGDNLAFYNNEGKAYICDLSKLPKKVSDCKLINREEEYIYNPVMNKTDPTRFAYTKLNSTEQNITMTIVKIENGEFKYTDSTLPCQSKKEVTGWGVHQFKDDMIVHAEVFKVDQDKRSAQLCYYDVKTQKNTCQNWADQGIADFEGSKYLLYHTFLATGLILRDVECYCNDKPEACPFDEYMPETPVLKKK